MKRTHLAYMCAGALALAFFALPLRASVTATDDAGNEVTLPRPAQRIISLAPHATELLFAAGAGRRVVGVVAYSDWPREARALPKIGDATALDLERILALAPDLVVAWPYTMPGQLAALRGHGVPIFVSSPASITGIARDVEALGTLAGYRGRGTRHPPQRCARATTRCARSTQVPRSSLFSMKCGTSRCRPSAGSI